MQSADGIRPVQDLPRPHGGTRGAQVDFPAGQTLPD